MLLEFLSAVLYNSLFNRMKLYHVRRLPTELASVWRGRGDGLKKKLQHQYQNTVPAVLNTQYKLYSSWKTYCSKQKACAAGMG